MEMSKAELQSAAQASALSQTPIEINGSDILVKSLQAEGVQFVWGYPGGAVLHIYDALYKQNTIEQCWCGMNRQLSTPLMAMPVPQAK